jgi:hypothetical protein
MKQTKPLLRTTTQFRSADRITSQSGRRSATRFYVTGCRKDSEAVGQAHRSDSASASERTALNRHCDPWTDRETRTLGRLITVCAWCTKIRGTKGQWLQLETDFLPGWNYSHGICPQCAEETYNAYRAQTPTLPDASSFHAASTLSQTEIRLAAVS